MSEERARYEVLFEHMDTRFNALAEQVGVLIAGQATANVRFDRIEAKVDRLEIKVDVLDSRVGALEAKVDKLDVFASDAQQRLGRIETHLELNGSGPRKTTRTTPARRSKKR